MIPTPHPPHFCTHIHNTQITKIWTFFIVINIQSTCSFNSHNWGSSYVHNSDPVTHRIVTLTFLCQVHAMLQKILQQLLTNFPFLLVAQ